MHEKTPQKHALDAASDVSRRPHAMRGIPEITSAPGSKCRQLHKPLRKAFASLWFCICWCRVCDKDDGGVATASRGVCIR